MDISRIINPQAEPRQTQQNVIHSSQNVLLGDPEVLHARRWEEKKARRENANARRGKRLDSQRTPEHSNGYQQPRSAITNSSMRFDPVRSCIETTAPHVQVSNFSTGPTRSSGRKAEDGPSRAGGGNDVLGQLGDALVTRPSASSAVLSTPRPIVSENSFQFVAAPQKRPTDMHGRVALSPTPVPPSPSVTNLEGEAMPNSDLVRRGASPTHSTFISFAENPKQKKNAPPKRKSKRPEALQKEMYGEMLRRLKSLPNPPRTFSIEESQHEDDMKLWAWEAIRNEFGDWFKGKTGKSDERTKRNNYYRDIRSWLQQAQSVKELYWHLINPKRT
ncbi:hypothetical protein T439DRAFT_354929 [Meredithblackwellia eburnea MCA 4105]